jgi:hypothetical protein
MQRHGIEIVASLLAAQGIEARVYDAEETDATNYLRLSDVSGTSLADQVSQRDVQLSAFDRTYGAAHARVSAALGVLCSAGVDIASATVVIYNTEDKLWLATADVTLVSEI